jgi:multiple sugar transport system substrate-binding protein/raffinose/stachyose/melibiose transport system substrate-binding protein
MKLLRILLLTVILIGVVACGPSGVDTAVSPTDPPPTETTAPPTETAVPATETPPPTATTPPPSPTPAELLIDYLAYYGGADSGVWARGSVEAFAEENPPVTVNDVQSFSLYSDPVPVSIHDRLAEDDPPDLITGYIGGNLRRHIAAGRIADVSDVWSEQEWDQAFPASLKEMATRDGKQYFVPQAIQWNPIWYRSDIFEEVGLEPPQSWDEFLTACDALHEAGYIPVAVSSQGWLPPLARWFTILNMRLNGPDFHERLMAGAASYDSPEVRAVFEHWLQLFEHNCFAEEPTNYREAANQLFFDEAAMYNLGEWLSESYVNGLPDTYDFFSFPLINPDVPRGEIALVYGAYVHAEAPHPDAARQFLAHLGSAASQTTRMEDLGQLVANLNVDHSQYDPIYEKGMDFTAEADHLTTLFEFNAAPQVASTGLQIFASFFRNRDPDQIDQFLSDLEGARQLAHGDVTE